MPKNSALTSFIPFSFVVIGSENLPLSSVLTMFSTSSMIMVTFTPLIAFPSLSTKLPVMFTFSPTNISSIGSRVNVVFSFTTSGSTMLSISAAALGLYSSSPTNSAFTSLILASTVV